MIWSQLISLYTAGFKKIKLETKQKQEITRDSSDKQAAAAATPGVRVPTTAEVPVFDVKYKSRMRFRDMANCKKKSRDTVWRLKDHHTNYKTSGMQIQINNKVRASWVPHWVFKPHCSSCRRAECRVWGRYTHSHPCWRDSYASLSHQILQVVPEAGSDLTILHLEQGTQARNYVSGGGMGRVSGACQFCVSWECFRELTHETLWKSHSWCQTPAGPTPVLSPPEVSETHLASLQNQTQLTLTKPHWLANVFYSC